MSYADFFREFPWLVPVFAFGLGAIVGSFLNVVIFRIPAGRSLVRPGSTCACGQPVAWRDNIPILSWILLRGRARCCGQPFSFRYPTVEALTGLIFVALVLAFPLPKAVCGAIFASGLLCAAFIDLDTFEIPDVFSVGLALLGVVLAFFVPSLHGHGGAPELVGELRSGFTALRGMLIGSALLLWIALTSEMILKKDAIGFGDVKFLGAIGAFCGWTGAVTAIFGGALLGTAWFVGAWIFGKVRGRPVMIRQPDEGTDNKEVKFGTLLPYGPMLAAAGLLHFLYLHRFIDPVFAAFAAEL